MIFAFPRFQKTLSNGLRISFAKTAPSGLVSLQIWVKTGSIHEENFLGSGISHFIEHMVFKGSGTMSAKEISRKIQAAGGFSNAYTTFERTVFYVEIPSEKIEIAFKVLAEMLVRPALSAKEFSREREVIFREMDMGKDEPERILQEATFAEIFRVHPYRIPVIGHRNLFEKLSAKNLREYFERRYTPELMEIVAAGDVENSEIFEFSEKYFGGVLRRNSAYVFVPEEPPQLAKREVKLFGNSNVLRGNAVWKIPGISHEDAPAIAVLLGVLGDGDSSILRQKLREKLEHVHEIEAFPWLPGKSGLAWIDYQADFGNAEKINEEIFKIVGEISRNGVPAKAIQKVVRRQIFSKINSQQSVSGTAAALGNDAVVFGDLGASENFISALKKIVPADLQRVAAKYFCEKNLTTSSFEKPQSSKKSTFQRNRNFENGSDVPEIFTLKNGIRILLRRNSSLPKIHLRATLLAGGAYENPRSRGATALLATMLGLDTKKNSAAKIAEKIESLGGNFYNDSGNNTLTLAVETLSENFEIAAEILAEALLFPKFSKENFARERASQIAALKEEMDDPVEFSLMKLHEKFFGKHFLSTHFLGNEKTLKNLCLSDLEALRERVLVPENLVISAVGNFSPNEVFEVLKTKFEKMFSRKKFTRERQKFEKPAVPGTIFVQKNFEQTIAILAFPSCGFSDEKRLVPEILSEIFNGMSSKIFEEIREKLGLAYFVSANFSGTPDSGIFYFYSGTTAENSEKVLSKMREEIRRIRAGKISLEEFEAAKFRVKIKRRAARQRFSNQTLSDALNALYEIPFEARKDFEAKIDAVVPAEISGFANDFFSDNNSLEIVVGKKKKLRIP